MCCRACSGYDICQARSKLTDDCCPQCRYSDSCLEESPEEEGKPKVSERPKRRAVRP